MTRVTEHGGYSSHRWHTCEPAQKGQGNRAALVRALRAQVLAAAGGAWYSRRVPPLLEVGRLPRHVAIIMDGNGRWAQLLGLPRTEGHRRGAEAVREVTRASRRLGVRALTLYAFSEQNWARPLEEVEALMGLLREFLISERSEILDNNIQLRSIGRLERLPPMVRDVLDPLMAESANHTGMVLTLALSYGGREEIADTAREVALRAASGDLDPSTVTEALFGSLLPSMEAGPVDLLIRTGGDHRISNFLLWGTAYAELFFSPKLWPDYTQSDLYEAISAFQIRERRFGCVPSDVASPGESEHCNVERDHVHG